MEFFSKIIEKFSVNQRLWALIVLVFCVILISGIKIIPETFGNHNCTECRQDIRQCNQEYAELASTVREFIRVKEQIVIEEPRIDEIQEVDEMAYEPEVMESGEGASGREPASAQRMITIERSMPPVVDSLKYEEDRILEKMKQITKK